MKKIKFTTIFILITFIPLFAQPFNWSPLSKITNRDYFYASQPDLFVDENDSLCLTYLGHEGGLTDIVTLYFTESDGDTWSEPFKLTDSAEVYSHNIVKNSKGNIFIFYGRFFGEYGESFVLKRENSVWQEPIPIAYEYGGHSERQEMVIDGNDNIYVFYSNFDGIFWRKYDGQNWSDIDTIDLIPDWGTVTFQSKAVVDRKNNVHLIYKNFGPVPTTYALYYRKYNGSDWSDEEMISDIKYNSSGPRQYSITVDSRDQPHVVYTLPNDAYPSHILILYYTKIDYKTNNWNLPDSITTSENGDVFLPKVKINPIDNLPIVLATIDTNTWGALEDYHNFFIYNKNNNWIIEKTFDHFPLENPINHNFDFEFDSQNNINYIFSSWDLYYQKGDQLTSIINERDNLLDNFNLFAYPNPFNSNIKINYNLPINGETTITIFDTLGREIKEILSEYKTKGEHEIIFNSDNLSSGVYLIKLDAGQYSKTKKIVLTK